MQFKIVTSQFSLDMLNLPEVFEYISFAICWYDIFPPTQFDSDLGFY